MQSTRVKPFSLNTIDAICESRFDGFNEFCGTDSPMRTGCAGQPGTIPRFPSVAVAGRSSRLYTRERAPGKLSPTRNCERLQSELQSPALSSRVSFPSPRYTGQSLVTREMHFVTRYRSQRSIAHICGSFFRCNC